MLGPNFQDNLQFDIRFTAEDSKVHLHKALTFTLIYIIEGYGIHHLERTNFSYEKGDIFIVVPGEEIHFLHAIEATKFLVVKFTNLFIASEKLDKSEKYNLLQLLQYANQNPDYILHLRNKESLICHLIDTLLTEINAKQDCNLRYIQNLVYMIILVIEKMLKELLPSNIDEQVDQKIVDMLHYIHLNIFNPKKLTVEEMSKKFFISPAYVGRYFKSNTNQNLHQYILLYKIRLIESRLKNSDMRICEIADEFGFNDKSYLSKIFVKYNGISPAMYRNKIKDKPINKLDYNYA